MKLTLLEKRQEGPDIYSFIFKPDQKIEFKPGQFMRYRIEDPQADERGVGRFFSIAAPPFEGTIRITTKFASDGSSFKKYLSKMNASDTIEATGPNGSFTLEDPNKEYVFIAGGIGITPFRSIILDLNSKNLPINITLLYANRVENPVYAEELEEIAKNNPNFKIHYFIGDKKIDEQAIKELIPDLQKPIFYISGPEPMVQAFEKMLASMSIPDEHIKRDYFPGYSEI